MCPIRVKADPRAAALRCLKALRQLSDRELNLLARSLDEVDLPAGALLTREGRIGDDCYLIIEGEAEVTIGGSSVARVGPGEFVGEMALLSGGLRSATVRAMTPMHLFTMHKSVFAALLENAPVTRTLLTQMSDRLRQADAAASPRTW